MEVGKFQGMMCPTTPIGSIKIYACNSRASSSTSPVITVYKNRLLYLSFLSLSLVADLRVSQITGFHGVHAF